MKKKGEKEKERKKKRKHVAPWDLLGIVEGVVWFVARRSRAPPFSLPGTPPLPFFSSLPHTPPLSIPLVRRGEGHLSMGWVSSGLSLGDGWFYPNAINSPTVRVHASGGGRNSPSCLPPSTLSRIPPLPTDLAERRISSPVYVPRWNAFERGSEDEKRKKLEKRRNPKKVNAPLPNPFYWNFPSDINGIFTARLQNTHTHIYIGTDRIIYTRSQAYRLTRSKTSGTQGDSTA